MQKLVREIEEINLNPFRKIGNLGQEIKKLYSFVYHYIELRKMWKGSRDISF